MTIHTPFDEIADIGTKFRRSLSRGPSQLQQYKWQLGAICSLLTHTHSLVIKKLEALDKAASLQAAMTILQDLESQPLSDSFRMGGLCDVFEGFGKSLRRIVAPQPSGPPASRGSVRTAGRRKRAEPELPGKLPISSAEESTWLHFCDRLEGREAEIAHLYANILQDIIRAGRAGQKQDLSDLKKRAKLARDLLTDQKADFEALADRFRQAPTL